jgi:shikimate dehydrogenase
MMHMITGKTGVMGLIGDPVEHSLSAPMHNAAFEHLNLDYVYVPFQVKKAHLKTAIHGARSLGIKGLNVTIPHKTEVLNYLNVLDDAAELIGAVNTIKFDENGTKGYNTDGLGAVKAMEEVTSIKDKKILIIGAGGASRAISFQTILSGAGRVVIANRTPEKAFLLKDDLREKLDADVGCIGLDGLKKEIQDADILINTTPIGMYPNINQKPLVTAEMIPERLVVNDIIYNPQETVLLREAGKAGAKTVSGVKMLIYQGIESFKIWTGVTPPVEVFEKALMDTL